MTNAIRLKSPGDAGQLEYGVVDLLPPGAGEIQLRQTAIGVNFIDIYQRMGLYPLPPPAIPGVEAVGVVTAVGADVVSCRVGDRLAYAGAPVGAYVSARNLPAWRGVKLPEVLPDELVASVFVKGITAHMLMTRIYPVARGTVMLVHGAAGGLGQLMVRWGSHLDATVIGVVGSGAKAAIAAGAGAHHVIIGRDADVAGSVAELTGGRGVDVAYDGVGGTGFTRTMACVRPFGVVASIGQAAGPIPPVDVEALGPRRSLILARPSVMAYMNVTGDYLTAANTVLSLIAEGVLVATGTPYRLSEAARAHSELEAGRTSGSLYLLP